MTAHRVRVELWDKYRWVPCVYVGEADIQVGGQFRILIDGVVVWDNVPKPPNKTS